MNSGVGFSMTLPPRIRLEVFSTIHEWIDQGGGAQDALDDPQLFDALKRFLVTTAVAKIPQSTDFEDRPAWIELENARQGTLSVFMLQTRRPKLQTSSGRDSTLALTAHNFGRQPPSIDSIDPETLVDNLDALAATALRFVTHEVGQLICLLHIAHVTPQGLLCHR